MLQSKCTSTHDAQVSQPHPACIVAPCPPGSTPRAQPAVRPPRTNTPSQWRAGPGAGRRRSRSGTPRDRSPGGWEYHGRWGVWVTRCVEWRYMRYECTMRPLQCHRCLPAQAAPALSTLGARSICTGRSRPSDVSSFIPPHTHTHLEVGQAAAVAQVVAAPLRQQEVVVGARQPLHQAAAAAAAWRGQRGKAVGQGTASCVRSACMQVSQMHLFNWCRPLLQS